MTVPSTLNSRPSNRAASASAPLSTAARMAVLLTAFPSTITGRWPVAVKPSFFPSTVRSERFPARSFPNAQSSPTQISRSGRQASASAWMKISGGCAANAASNPSTRTCAIPASASRRILCRVDVSSGGALCGRSTAAGCGSKVATTGVPPAARAPAIVRSITARWPRWKPSKTPAAMTTGPAMSASSEIDRRTLALTLGGVAGYAPRRMETCGSVITLASTASSGPFFSTSALTALSTENFPLFVRRSALRCAPQPRSWPMSNA